MLLRSTCALRAGAPAAGRCQGLGIHIRRRSDASSQHAFQKPARRRRRAFESNWRKRAAACQPARLRSRPAVYDCAVGHARAGAGALLSMHAAVPASVAAFPQQQCTGGGVAVERCCREYLRPQRGTCRRKALPHTPPCKRCEKSLACSRNAWFARRRRVPGQRIRGMHAQKHMHAHIPGPIPRAPRESSWAVAAGGEGCPRLRAMPPGRCRRRCHAW